MRAIQLLIFPVLALTATIYFRDDYNNTRLAASSVLSRDFPDPSIIQIDGSWYAFATEGNGFNVQVARSADFNQPNWQIVNRQVLSNPGPWADTGQTWPPDVVQLVGAADCSLLSSGLYSDDE